MNPPTPNGSLTVGILGPMGRRQDAVEAIPTGIETSIEQVGEYTLGALRFPQRCLYGSRKRYW